MIQAASKYRIRAGIAQWLERRTCIERSRVRIPAGTGEKFLLRDQLSVLTLIAVSIPPQQHVKDPGHSVKSAGGTLQLNTCLDLQQFLVAPAMPAL